MDNHASRVHEAVTAAVADVKIATKEADALTDEDFDKIYELTDTVVSEATSSLMADAVVRAVRHYIEGFHKAVIEISENPEKFEEFVSGLKNMLQEQGFKLKEK